MLIVFLIFLRFDSFGGMMVVDEQGKHEAVAGIALSRLGKERHKISSVAGQAPEDFFQLI